MKTLSIALLYCVSMTAMASCPRAVPTNDSDFCASFKSVAVCHCTSSGIPAGMCTDMNALYSRMISLFGTLQRVCAYQRHTSTQDCIDNWTCYRQGGIDSQGRECSATQKACT